MKIGAFYFPSVGRQSDIEQGMAGKRTDLYQQMLTELSEQIRYLDQHGYYGVAFTEHHFHIEGEEVSTNPIMLDLHFGHQTQHLRFGQLGQVLPAHNPVEVAENIALLSQMLKGRVFAGFARGYQARWLNVFAQHEGLATPSSGADYEATKVSLFRESIEIIQKAWREDTFSHHGEHWQIPPKDIQWPAADVAWELGKGCDSSGVIQEIGIAPSLFENRIPDLFMPFAVTEESIRWAAARDIIPVTMLTNPVSLSHYQDAALEAAEQSGRSRAPGEKMAMAREIIVAETDEKANEIARGALSFIWNKFFVPFGFNAAFMRPGEDPSTIPATFETLVERGGVICGSPDTVCEKLDAIFRNFPVEYFWMFMANHLPPEQTMQNLELMTQKVWPNFSSQIH